jgi:flagellar biosynthesis/type III secretory pathway protein FliH
MLAKKHPELKKAVKFAKILSFREKWRYTLLYWQMKRMDERQFQRQWKEEGFAEGRAEGSEKRREEVLELIAQGLT